MFDHFLRAPPESLRLGKEHPDTQQTERKLQEIARIQKQFLGVEVLLEAHRLGSPLVTFQGSVRGRAGWARFICLTYIQISQVGAELCRKGA